MFGIRSFAVVAPVLVFAACYPKSAPPPTTVTSADVTAAQTKWPDASEASLTDGRTVFLAHCNNCHDYPAMSAESDAKWPDAVDSMAKKAKLNPTEKQDVLRFILTAHARQAQPAP